MSKTYVFEIENEDGVPEMQYITLSDEQVDRICRAYIENCINRDIAI